MGGLAPCGLQHMVTLGSRAYHTSGLLGLLRRCSNAALENDLGSQPVFLSRILNTGTLKGSGHVESHARGNILLGV